MLGKVLFCSALHKSFGAGMIRNRIKELVDSRGISVYRFWKDTGIGQNTAYDLYRHPERYPMADVMEAICRTYGVSPGDILEYVPDSDPTNEQPA
jgi:DNA-binding Xre family transcriptional regulator